MQQRLFLRKAWFWGILIFFLALHLTSIIRITYENVGYVFLNRGLRDFSGDFLPQEWGQRAEIYLQGAVDSPDPRSSAVRGLGLSLALQGKTQDAAASWQTIPEMELELLQLGHHAREGKQYTLAMQWYAWAAAMQADWRDPIY
ncbi:MAG: hypothetical protein KC413_06445, partial [Anaerolineales bacterium]|nr:hypothetical protein [Anaerolineales bacterium]